MKIIKRDGREVPFDRSKIVAAIQAANADVPDDALDTAAEAKDGCPVGAIEEA